MDHGVKEHIREIKLLTSLACRCENEIMQIPSLTNGAPESSPAAGLGIDTSNIITQLASVKEARALPSGSVVGDLHGGLTFTDAVAAALEARSRGGWREIRTPACETWTVIVLDR